MFRHLAVYLLLVKNLQPLLNLILPCKTLLPWCPLTSGGRVCRALAHLVFLVQPSADAPRFRCVQLMPLCRLLPRLHLFLPTLVDGAVKPCGRRPKRLLGLIPTLRE